MKERYFVKEINFKTANEVIVKEHYLHRRASYLHAYGLFEKDTNKLVGVINYGIPASSTLLKGICGESEKNNIYELNRLWVDDSVPRNGESLLISASIKKLDREIIVSYADTSVHHIGIVYQASNFLYTGLSAKFYDYVVKGKENMHRATYAYSLTVEELKAKYGEDNVYRVERPRKHRYVYFNATKRRKAELIKKLKYKILPYPKMKILPKKSITKIKTKFVLTIGISKEVCA